MKKAYDPEAARQKTQLLRIVAKQFYNISTTIIIQNYKRVAEIGELCFYKNKNTTPIVCEITIVLQRSTVYSIVKLLAFLFYHNPHR